MNLLLNGIQAIRDKGNIWINTKQTGKDIQIIIKDDGKGIPVNVRDKIFDPFFTTKSVGMGTGLGLSISYGIVEKHGGSIDLDTEEGRGTTFTISLPINSQLVKEAIK